jgi:hypothetical protein
VVVTPDEFDRFYRTAPPDSAPSGIFCRAAVDDGELLFTDAITSTASAETIAIHHGDQLRARVNERRETIYLFLYDGDTGECVNTCLFAPDEPHICPEAS